MTKRLRLGLALAAALAFPARTFAQADVVEYYHLDALGNVMAVSNAAGAEIESHDYLPFGEEWCGSAVCGTVKAGQPKRFTGKERDAETGLDYFGARYYGSKMGRFTTVDPAMEIDRSILDPQNWNRYAYARNNPLRNVDPDGRSWVKAGKVILNGGDIASTFAGVVEAGAIIVSGNPAIGTGARMLAVGSLLGEVSGVTDLVKGGKAVLGAAKGGTYLLRKADDAGDVMRTGRTNDLARRRGEHARDPRTQDLEFEVDRCTDCYAAQRGREQVIHDRHKPPLNRVNPVSPNNPRRDEYLQAAEKIKDPQ